MGRRSNGQNGTTFTEAHIERIVRALGLSVGQETVHDYLMFCPFHNNSDTPSLSVSKRTAKYICFNPGCDSRGDLMSLIKHVKEFNDYEALRFIINIAPDHQQDFEQSIADALTTKEDFAIFDPLIIDKMAKDFWSYIPPQEYMQSRSFTADTLRDFGVGWSVKKQLVTVPCYSHTSVPVGVIGRSIEGKRFKNSIGFPSARVFFNLNRAIRVSSTAIITESSFDAMRVHQAGYPNVIATLGGHLSPFKKDLLNKYFDRIIIMTDNDSLRYNEGLCNPCGGICKGHNPGRDLGHEIAQSFTRDTLWAQWDESTVYPHQAKDAGDLTDDEIRIVIDNAIPDFEYALRKTLV